MQELNRLVMNIADGARAAHAFVVEGMAGEARGAFIRGLAKGLECEADEGARPCGRCPSCRQVEAGTSMDVVYMKKSPGASKAAAPSYKVRDAADFIERLNMGAYGRFLIGIIEDADSLNEVVQNKLLKTLEEPAPGTILILAASNRDNLLSTVRSRCSDIRLSDYVADEEAEQGPADTAKNQHFAEIAHMLEDSKTAFHEFRTAVDKHIKSKDDALILLDILEDDLRLGMTGANAESGAGNGSSGSSGSYSPQDGSSGSIAPQVAASCIELTAIARMDIRRDMAYAKALKRLFLEINA
ncbi:MAG: hypothetical protein IJI11_03945 [Mogibacterium sp.]|nr:hypothetical protein [Mogibacterium sp.]